MLKPAGGLETLDDSGELARAIEAWRKLLSDDAASLALLKTVEAPEATPDGIIYPIATPEGLVGDFAFVDMSGVTVDTPHSHVEGEVEVHFPLLGSAVMSVGDTVVELQPGDTQVVSPDTPHFILPADEYVVGVLSFPGYDPEHQLPVDLANPPQQFNAGLYTSSVGAVL